MSGSRGEFFLCVSCAFFKFNFNYENGVAEPAKPDAQELTNLGILPLAASSFLIIHVYDYM